MADPLTAWAAVGAAGSLIQIVEFTTKLVKGTREFMNGPGNALKTNEVLEQLTLTHASLADQILHAENAQRSDQAICRLARECKEASGDLLKLLGELKVSDGLHGPRKAWHSASKARKALQKRRSIEQKQQHIKELTGQLSTALLLDLKSNHLSKLQDVYERVGEAETRNAALIVESREAILKSTEREQDRRKYIIQSLRFPEMHLRRDAIPDAYSTTFDWLFTDQSPFRSWLTTSNNIFWITGKAGSGKSTAMKFIAGRSETKQLLSGWAGDRKITIAQNYMWNPGHLLQRNEGGMLQEILYHILAADPDLGYLLPSSRWQDGLESLQQDDTWSRDELVQSLECIFQQTLDRLCYCIFIDGLDEYEGEHPRLTALIMDLSQHSNVKICLSSRPWNVFRNAFEKLDDKIYVHELTKDDIFTYVSGELGKIVNIDNVAQELISAIVDKARGVFLWVYLVVRSLREGFEEGDSVQLMRQRVDEFPAELEAFFIHMLSRLNKTYRQDMVRALSLATKILAKDGPIRIHGSASFIPFWLLSEGHLARPNFAFEYEPHFVTNSEIRAMAADTRKYLNKSCRDFLYVTYPSSGFERLGDEACSLRPYPRVEYMHRTVYDFLHSEEMQPLFSNETPDHFNNVLFEVHVALIQHKVKGRHGKHFCYSCAREIWSAIKAISPTERQSRDTIAQFEKLAAELIDFSCTEFNCLQELHEEALLENMCVTFASYSLSTFIETVSDRFPGCISEMERVGNPDILMAALGLSSRRSFPSSHVDLRSLHIILRAGKYHQFLLGTVAKKLGRKALTEAQTWTQVDEQHVALVIKTLISHGMDVVVMPRLLMDQLKRYLADDIERTYSTYSRSCSGIRKLN